MSKVLEINSLNYKKNNKLILKDINLSLDNGKIIGLLGANGAGKTTLMRLISGVNAKTSGQIAVAGVDSKAARKSCVSATYSLTSFNKGAGEKNTKVKDVVKFYIDIYPDFSFEKYQAMAKFLEIPCDDKLVNLSTGTGEKLEIALTLARQVPLYLLDEPLNGVDIMARKKIIKSIIQWKGDDSTIIISSHYVKEISSLLDDVVILKDQTVYQVSPVEDIQAKYHLGIEDYYEKVYEGGLDDE
ncbi:ABC transporter ATP-binding protein [Companilactobacillus heilongjiangensis]|uniref:ABC transporter ATP-binding protein n=1 Tax=Companilactobacillus heilongjiangensis TaxID=1074467 RepID=A0A0K2LF75_9LACO|nr:ABC transporter ATP-binding protein [Companilactobacillus heilongjiangensis]ALB29925.1 ABC transporter ATP-binding protein [Companilactobacillus heilongjiangensis]